jgi:hypothetical protein
MSAEEFWPIWLKQRFPEYKDQAAAFTEEWGWRTVAWEFAEAYKEQGVPNGLRNY